MSEQELVGHNRWHPDIPAVVSVNPGDVFRIECKDWTDGQIKNDDSPDDIRDVDLTVVHVLSGPIYVNGAQPGDILVVDILDIGALQGDEWGFTGIFAKENGGGFLTEHFPTAAKAIWDFQGIYTASRHIPKVRFAGITHPGLIGCAPSVELLNKWNKREAELVATNPDRVPPLAELPNPKNAILGSLKQSEFERVAAKRRALFLPANTAAIAILKTCRAVREFTSRFMSKARNFRWEIFTFLKETGRFHSAGQLKCRGTSTSTLILSKAAWINTRWSTRFSNPGRWSPAILSTWFLKGFLLMNLLVSSIIWMLTLLIAELV
jgi:Predicted acetamidase/formamidase